MRSTLNVGWFADISLNDRSDVGGKGGSLGELQRAGIAVPPGFVVKTAAFEAMLASLESESPLRSRIQSLAPDNLAAIAACCEQIRARVESAPIPAAVLHEIAEAHAALCGNKTLVPVAVRSSATTEDAVDASFAGLQDTYLWVNDLGKALQKVKSCWASLYSLESVSYRLRRGFA